MIIQPLNNQIVVKPTEKKQVLVSDNKNLCLYGEVLFIGPDVSKIAVGDTIIYEMWGLKSPEINDEKVHFIREDSEFLLGKLIM